MEEIIIIKQQHHLQLIIIIIMHKVKIEDVDLKIAKNILGIVVVLLFLYLFYLLY